MKNPGPKTTFEVGMLAGDSWKKVLILAFVAFIFPHHVILKFMGSCFFQVNSSKGNGNTNVNGVTKKSKVQAPPIVDPNPKVCLNYDMWFLILYPVGCFTEFSTLFLSSNRVAILIQIQRKRWLRAS
jgi:hypothetical protein